MTILSHRSRRVKGANGEKELFALLSNELGFVVKRELAASRDGGCDCLDIPGWAVEVKRTEFYRPQFWEQAKLQAFNEERSPVLFWRKSRARWVVFVDPCDLAPNLFSSVGDPIQMTLPRWCELARSLFTGKES